MSRQPDSPSTNQDFFTERMKLFGQFAEEFRDESDRGCAVLVMCVLEDSLHDMFKGLLVSEGGHALSNLAPPGGLKKTLENAVALGLLSERQRRAFKALADVRNKFAHRPLQKLTFENPDIAALLRSAPLAAHLPMATASDQTARTHFLLSAAILWVLMTFKIPKIQRLNAEVDYTTDSVAED